MTDKEARPSSEFDEVKTRARTAILVKRLGELQHMLYAESKKSILVIFQGMDASGKDGAIKNVFADTNPVGLQVTSFKKPTETELAHDFLWRIHASTPQSGMIGIFNRSHYEDILVPVVEGYISKTIISRRFDQINQFEKILEQNGITVLKFFLHVSTGEQKERLQERMTNPKKFWKHKDGDWITRSKWKQYMNAYDEIFLKCNAVPWHIIPSDKNWYKEFLIAEKLVVALEKINPKFPPLVTNMKLPK